MAGLRAATFCGRDRLPGLGVERRGRALPGEALAKERAKTPQARAEEAERAVARRARESPDRAHELRESPDRALERER